MIRQRTFTKRTIKHSFQKSGIWPISFKQVKRKIKEYRKKSKKDTSLDFLEFSSDPDSSNTEVERVDVLILDPQLEEYQLPSLLCPLSYSDCVFQLKELDKKVIPAVNSPTHHRYQSVYKAIDAFLMQACLHKMEMNNARQAQIEVHKAKLNARLSL